MSDDTRAAEEIVGETTNQKIGEKRPARKPYRILGFVFIGLAILLAIYGTIFFIAWDRGQVQKAHEEESALAGELENQMSLAMVEADSGSYNLARRRLEWILERDPGYPGAVELLNELQSLLNKPATPTAIALETSEPASEPSPPAGLDSDVEFGELEKLVDEERWDQAITAIIAFQSKYPDIRRQDTDKLLYNAYLNLGQITVMGDQVELGLFYLEQAEKLGDLPSGAEDQRTWADLYLLGISYYGIDWDTSLFYFRGLCAAAPFYQDSCRKLYGILIISGDQYMANMDYCPAEALYFEASHIDSDDSLQEKTEQAREGCQEATPTPEPTLTPAIPITGTATLESNLPVPIFSGS